MYPLRRPIVLGSSFLLGIAIAVVAQPVRGTAEQLAALPPSATPAPPTLTLPEVIVRPEQYALPYTNGGGPRVSSYSIPSTEHRGWSLDAADPALHPYTSGLGPRVSSNHALPVERYEVPADYESNVAMHPYTSLQGPCPEGGNAGPDICKRLISASKYRPSREGH